MLDHMFAQEIVFSHEYQVQYRFVPVVLNLQLWQDQQHGYLESSHKFMTFWVFEISSQSSSAGPWTGVEGSFKNSLSGFPTIARGVSLGICSIAMQSWESSSDAIMHASASSIIKSDLGMTSHGLRLSSASAVCSALTLGVWIGAGADTRRGLGAALALKNEWND